MQKTVEIDGQEVQVTKDKYGYTVQELPTFTEYLDEHVLRLGGYNYDTSPTYGDVGVAEHGGGGGFVCLDDMRRIRESDDVRIVSVKDGWLLLSDER